MNAWMLNLLLVGLSATELPVGTELQYAGSLGQKVKGGVSEVKSVAVTATAIAAADGNTQLAWSLDERGGGGWAWPERFGVLSSQATDGAANKSGKVHPIRLLHQHDGTQYPLPVRSPVFEFRDKLTPESSWSDGRLEYVVTRKRKFRDRDCVQIEVASNIGRAQTLVVEAATGVLVSLDERVFMGRGDEFQLKLELQSQKTLSSADISKTATAFASLQSLQQSLNRTGEQKVVELTPPQLKDAQAVVSKIEKQAEGTSWSRLAGVIVRDLVQQEQRLAGVAGLGKRFLGQPAPAMKLKLANGTVVPEADLKGQVVVLHFWEYRGEPLSEPYGQVGYLEFLNNKRKKLGAKVIGVNVDARFADAEKSREAIRSAKKLTEFFNLGYDVASDDGAVLTSFGDPRSLGSPLPLWVVIDHEGKIAHYHIGFYDIKPDEGLRELDDAVVAALRKQKEKAK